ncbi:right-handed parallel beta-helix repeat-containing protein [Paenibacillus sp. NFR01]|uniref:right-handed parallel beta-helix repeat-containing protein n=1 Tax=Paenibacillus sp. NFR01 TaxID=1566279 RepID=UPI0008C348C1|nr:right-handed parallel beta-helix repeat-containing protein [Paenibacillus sp. NFR01]SET68134.1 Right handed beta helix region [Paenibacillus sp. NFR01]
MCGTGNEMLPLVLTLSDFGILPDSDMDAQPAMRLALEAAAMAGGPVVLDCPPGVYQFYPEAAIRLPYHISNTASEEERRDVLKTIGLHFKDLRHLTLEGNGSLFIFHGKQTMFVLDGCIGVEIRNVYVDYACPTVTEMTVIDAGDGYLDVSVHPDSRYELSNGRVDWVGEGWRFTEGPMQVYDPAGNITWRTDNRLERASYAEELEPGRLRLHVDPGPDIAAGMVLQARDGIRDQAGVFITGSTNIRFTACGLHFMHGLGIVGQFSRDLSFRQLALAPRPETGRTVAGFADFIHLSGCRGKVEITDCRFTGAHDDAVNVHGTYLRIVGRPADNQVRVRFMHPQTYGFQPFFPGDQIEFVAAESLTAYAEGRVEAVQWLNPRELLLTLASRTPQDIGPQDVIENVTWTPEVEIRNNSFERIPTRGILISTRRRTVIAGNRFERMRMSGVLIAGDAASWYESGGVQDVEITDNVFIECGGIGQPVINIAPENSVRSDGTPVHRNIAICGNDFKLSHSCILNAKSTQGLLFRDNAIWVAEQAQLPQPEEAFRLTACRNTEFSDNRWTVKGETVSPWPEQR